MTAEAPETPPEGLRWPPVHVGPTWEPAGPGDRSWDGYKVPEATLGWHVLAWTATWLQHRTGQRWTCTREQARFLLHWFEVDADLRWRYVTGTLQRLKGWGKDPLLALLSAVEFIGPCRPDPSGRTVRDLWGREHPAGVPHPEAWVCLTAVSKDQTRNTTTLFPRLFTPAAIDLYGVQIGKTILYAHGGAARIEAFTSSPATLEGARSTFTGKNETHHWGSSNDGHAMADVIERNSAKSEDGGARDLSITNAYAEGEDTVAERERLAWEDIAAGKHEDPGMLYDSLEAPPEAPLTDAVEVVRGVRGDSTWVDLDRVRRSIISPRNPPGRSRRWWFNQIQAPDDAWITRHEWDAAADQARAIPDGAMVTLGFDGAETDDCAALCGSLLDVDHTFTLKVWTPTPVGAVDLAAVDGEVRQAFTRFDVVGFYSDYYPLQSYVDAWGQEFGSGLPLKAGPKHAVAWDMRTRTRAFTVAVEALQAAALTSAKEAAKAVEEDRPAARVWTHDGHPEAAQHAYNAGLAPNRYGVSVRKRRRSLKIDAVPAMTLARLARSDYMALPEARRRKTRTGRAVFL